MSEKNKPLEQQFYMPPPKVSGWESFKTFLWNSETSQLLGRTGSSWAKILAFYVVFYVALAGFFAAMLAVFFQTLDNKVPKWTLENSLIGGNPGLGFRPMPPSDNVDSTLIWYKSSDPNNYMRWTKQLDDFLEIYRTMNQTLTQQCNYERPPQSNEACSVDIQFIHPCTMNETYNYQKGGPCIFLKLNRIFNWIPQFYNDSSNLPELMNDDLKNYIRSADKKSLNTVWVSCEGENPADVENIGPMHFIPRRGFPGYYFPFQNQPHYLSPLVVVYFEKPKSGVLINIECKAWAKNIVHDRNERRGSVHFELMVDV